jgi:tubulin--tyrosine ligase-like protein 12
LFEKLKGYAGSYSISKGVISEPVWFLQDEVGSSMGHSDSPNVRVVPFMYSPANSATDSDALSFNVMWPVKDITVNDAIYRDFLEGYSEE